MYRYLLACCICLIFVTGCKKDGNKYLIPKDSFKEILKELHLADGLYSNNYGQYYFHNDSLNFYNDIIRSHGYTFAQFDSTLKWYALNIEELDKIYADLITDFTKYIHELYQMDFAIKDTVLNLYKGEKQWDLPNDGLTKKIPFDIPVVDSGEYKIFVMAKRFDDDESEDLQITAFYWYKDSVTNKEHKLFFPVTKIEKGPLIRVYSTSLFLSNKKMKRLRGWILDHSNQSEHFKKHVQVKFIAIRRLNYEIL